MSVLKTGGMTSNWGWEKTAYCRRFKLGHPIETMTFLTCPGLLPCVWLCPAIQVPRHQGLVVEHANVIYLYRETMERWCFPRGFVGDMYPIKFHSLHNIVMIYHDLSWVIPVEPYFIIPIMYIYILSLYIYILSLYNILSYIISSLYTTSLSPCVQMFSSSEGGVFSVCLKACGSARDPRWPASRCWVLQRPDHKTGRILLERCTGKRGA